MKLSSFVARIALVAVLVPAGLAATEPVAVGDQAPRLELADLDGRVHTLEDATAEGPVIVVFFRGAW